jgi:hypothetical protein
MASNGVRALVLAAAAATIGAGCERLPPGVQAFLDHLRRGHPVPADAGVRPDASPPADAGTAPDVVGPDVAAPDVAAPPPDAAEPDAAQPDAPEPDPAQPGPTSSEACTPGARRCAPEGVVMQECTVREDACPTWLDDPRCIPCEEGTFVFCPGSGSGGFF